MKKAYFENISKIVDKWNSGKNELTYFKLITAEIHSNGRLKL